MVNTKRFILILCTLYIVPLYFTLKAHNSMLSIGVRGGGQTYLPTAALGASGEVRPGFGGTGTLDLRYTFYGCLTDRFGIGFTLGAGAGYGTSAIKGTSSDSYTNYDYLGNQIDYSINAAYKQSDRFAKAEASLMAAFCFGNIILNVGPRVMMPFATKSDITLSETTIDAYYPQYNVHVINEQITGKLDNSQFTMHNSQCAIPKYSLLIAAEVGYEWYFNDKTCLGLQLYADVGVWNKPSAVSYQPSALIQVAPITDAANPVPAITVGSIEPMIASRRYLDFGLRAYVAFSLIQDAYYKSRLSPARDTREHHNRYMRW